MAQLFEGWAARTPDAVALVAGQAVVHYAELNARANQLAHHLRRQGSGPNDRVAICLERSVDLVVSLLGVMKAGSAYVPLDPGNPPGRVAHLVQDSGARVLITTQGDRLKPWLAGTEVLSLDTGRPSLEQHSDRNPARPTRLDDLIYVVYTSGSTGQPKGVMVTHDSVLNMLFWHQHAFGITRTDRTTWLSSPAFDATGWELWPTLSAGASIEIVDDQVRVDPIALQRLLLERNVTVAFAPTALAEQLMTLPWPEVTSLRWLLTGADALHSFPPADLPFALVNNYGPTEATVLVTSGVVPPLTRSTQPPGMGRVIANTEIHLLDERLRPVPPGEVGEVHIGGKALAVGYLNRPDLTKEKFIPHPFSDVAGARLYKTGDLARYRPDGELGFAGRVDHQVKIRGYRIEPGEIVAALNRQPTIAASYVMAREDVPGNKRLVAYLIETPGERVQAGALRQALIEILPEYMVPAAFVVVKAFPSTANGKIDRLALPAPDPGHSLQDQVTSEPSTAIERRLATIVSSLLQLPSVDIDDNFFMLGGHSMLGAQVISRVAEAFAVDLPLRALFVAPSVRALAAEIETRLCDRIAGMSDDEARALL